MKVPNLKRSTEPKRRLKNITVNFVSLVPQGANPGAEILITKENNGMELQFNLDQKSVTDLITKALGGVGSTDGDAPIPMTEDNIKKAFSVVKEDLSTMVADLVNKAVEEANAKACEPKKADPKMDDPKEPVAKGLDETIKIGDNVICKSIVGDDVFASLKSMSTELAKQAYESELERLTLSVEKEYPNIPGESRTKALLLKSISGMPESVQTLAKSILSLAESGLSEKINKESGHSTIPSDSIGKEAETKLDQMAKEYASKHGISYFKAYQAVLESDAGANLYEKTYA